MEPRECISLAALIVAFAVYWSTQTARRRDRLLELRRERYLDLIGDISNLSVSINDMCWKIVNGDLFWKPNGTWFCTEKKTEEEKLRNKETARRLKELNAFEKCVGEVKAALEKVMICADPEFRDILIDLEVHLNDVIGRLVDNAIVPYVNLRQDMSAASEGHLAAADIKIGLSPARLFMGIYLSEKEHLASKWYSCLFCEKDPHENEGKIRDLENKRLARWEKQRELALEEIQKLPADIETPAAPNSKTLDG